MVADIDVLVIIFIVVVYFSAGSAFNAYNQQQLANK